MIPLSWGLGASAAALVAGLAGGYIKGHHDGFADVTADWNKQQIRQKDDYINRLRDANEQIEMLRLKDHERQESYETNLRGVSRQRDAALAGLRDRAERPAVPASGAGAEACKGASGAQLSRRDAEVLVGLAARADELRAALERCQGGDVATEGTRLDH